MHHFEKKILFGFKSIMHWYSFPKFQFLPTFWVFVRFRFFVITEDTIMNVSPLIKIKLSSNSSVYYYKKKKKKKQALYTRECQLLLVVEIWKIIDVFGFVSIVLGVLNLCQVEN